MDRETERCLARMEGKLNIILRSMGWIVSVGAGLIAYTYFDWGQYYAFGLFMLVGVTFDRSIASLEKRLPIGDDEAG
jgi:hypothetical protein